MLRYKTLRDNMKSCEKISGWALLVLMSLAPSAQASRWSHFLSQENVVRIRYDSVAQIHWFGTSNNGVWKFDGRRFERLVPMTMTGGRELRITALAVDAGRDTLWVGTPTGLFAYHPPTRTWTYAQAGDIRALLMTTAGVLWYGTKNCEIGNRRGIKWRLTNVNCVGIRCLTQEGPNTIYAGTDGAGLYRIDCREQAPCALTALNIPNLGNVISAIAVDRHKNKWLGTLNGVAVLDSANGLQRFSTANSGLIDNIINAIWIETYPQSETKWFGTTSGVSVLDGATALWLAYHSQNSGLAGKAIFDISGDHDGNLWFAFQNELGVSRLDNNWSELTTKNLGGKTCRRDDFFYAIENGAAGRLWSGNDLGDIEVLADGALKCLPVDNGRCQNLPSAARDFLPDQDGMWVATAGCGVLKVFNTFAVVSGSRLRRDNSGMPSDYVYALAMDKDTLWAGTALGLAKIVTKPFIAVVTTLADGLPAKRVNALAHDATGRLWIGTTRGLVIYDHGKLLPMVPEEISITALARDSSGAMWMGTEDGLYRFSGSERRRFSSQPDRLPDDRITCLGVAPDGMVWCGTANGAASFAGTQWIARTADDGLSNNFIRQITFAPGGVVWFATFGGGLARYRQSSLGPNTFIVNPFAVATETNVMFQYSGFDFNTPALNLTYQYKLDTMRMWSPVTAATFVTLPIDAAGTHLFRVRAIDRDGNADASPAALRFYRLQPERGGLVDSTIGWGGSRLQVYLPPASLPPGSSLRLAAIAADSLQLSDEEMKQFTGVAFQLLATKEASSANRPITLKIFYGDHFAPSADPRPLALYRYEAGKWAFIGGTVDSERRQITTTITQLGVIALFAGTPPSNTDPRRGFALTAQPRMLSPRFFDKVTISFELNQPTAITAKIYNLAGRLVQTVSENHAMNAGRNALEWNGRDRDGRLCPSGMYLICLQAQGRTETKTVLVVNQ